jgi:hypothetical protein
MALTDSLTEFWTLNNTLTGINGNTLVSPDGLTHYVAGKIGQAWDVGNVINQVLRQTPGPFNPGATDFSISIWAYVTDGTAPTTGYLFVIRDGTTFRFRFNFADAYSVNVYLFDGAEALALPEEGLQNGWNHIVLTFHPNVTSTTVAMWINGILGEQKTPTRMLSTMTTPNLYVGGSGAASGASAAYDEQIDAVGWWSRVLTDLEIADLYNSGAGWEPSVASVVTNILWGSTPDQSRILNSRIVRGML